MTTPDPIRILIADDHPIVREGLVALLNRRPDMQVVAERRPGGGAGFRGTPAGCHPARLAYAGDGRRGGD